MYLRIYIFGEDGFTNNTLAAALSLTGFDVIGESTNEKVAANMILHHCPDVVILQVDYARIKAVAIAKYIRKTFPNMGIVIISKNADLRLIGIEQKDLPVGVLITEIVNQGDLDSLKRAIENSLINTKRPTVIKECDFLTDCQVETIRLMAAGKANSEIARMRYVSEKSVEQMLARIAMMLGIVFDRKQNSRIRLINTYYELVNGRK